MLKGALAVVEQHRVTPYRLGEDLPALYHQFDCLSFIRMVALVAVHLVNNAELERTFALIAKGTQTSTMMDRLQSTLLFALSWVASGREGKIERAVGRCS